jgi:hypothetical protein
MRVRGKLLSSMFLHRHAELGAYTPHEFCIEMSADHPLVDETGTRVDPIPAETLSTFVHEYFHYLQNVSTVSGFAGYHATQQLLALFSATVDKSGRSAGSACFDSTQNDKLAQIRVYLDLLEGDEGPDDVALESVRKVDAHRRTLPFGSGVAFLSEVTLTCDVQNSYGEHRDELVLLGLCIIEEGLAFEIDRIVAGIDGQPVDLDAALSFAYLVLRMLGEHLAPGIDRRDLIACGVLALLTNDPAGILIKEIRDFGQRRAQGASRQDALAAVEEATRESRVESINIILKDVEGLKKMHAERGMAATAMERVGEIFGVLLQQRLEDPLWDVRPFIADELDQQALTNLLESVEPCLVRQRLPDNEDDPEDEDRPEHDLMLAFGKPGEATREMTKHAVPVLQCQVHYVTTHLPEDEFIASRDVEPEEAACPFYRSCRLQLRRDHAKTCKDAPWEIYERSVDNTCWYGAGVAATIGTAVVEPEPPLVSPV